MPGLAVTWQPLEGLVEGLRQIKTGAELAVMRRALTLTETVMRQVAGELVPGQTERQVAWEIEKRLREGGAEGMAFAPIVAAGPNSARPHHHPGDYPHRGRRAHHHRHGGPDRRLLRRHDPHLYHRPC